MPRRFTAPPISEGPSLGFRLPEMSVVRLRQGLRVLVVPLAGVGIARLQLLTRAGAERNPLSKPGLANLMGVLLSQGSARFERTEIERALEQEGISFQSGAGWDAVFVEARILGSQVGRSLEIAADAMRSPTFAEQQFDAHRQRHISSIVRSSQHLSARVESEFLSRVFPASPYGFSLAGTVESLESLALEDVRSFYRSTVDPADSCLIALGDFDPEMFVEYAEETLGTWETNLGKTPEAHAPRVDQSGPKILWSRQDSSPLVELLAGHRLTPVDFEDFLGLKVLGAVLTFQLNESLREDHGWTYGVTCHFDIRRKGGLFQIRTSVGGEAAAPAIIQILKILERCREQLSAGFVRRLRDKVVLGYAASLHDVGTISNLLERMFVFDLAPDRVDGLAEEILALSTENLVRLAQRHVRPEDLQVVVSGCGAPAPEALKSLFAVVEDEAFFDEST